ncbi:MAG: DUF1232 domain-containing protein, partial [Bacteroidota bacterium]
EVASKYRKLRKFAKKVGVKAVYSSLLLYYAYKRAETPNWAKRLIIGVLGYLIAPIDAIPDLTVFLGFTDDVGLLSFALVTVAAFINDDVRAQAREQLAGWFPNADEADLEAVDRKL